MTSTKIAKANLIIKDVELRENDKVIKVEYFNGIDKNVYQKKETLLSFKIDSTPFKIKRGEIEFDFLNPEFKSVELVNGTIVISCKLNKLDDTMFIATYNKPGILDRIKKFFNKSVKE